MVNEEPKPEEEPKKPAEGEEALKEKAKDIEETGK